MRRLLLFLFVGIFLIGGVSAVCEDGIERENSFAGNVWDGKWISGGEDRIFILETGERSSTPYTGVTLDGVPMTRAGYETTPSSNLTMEVWYMLEADLPSEGSYNIVFQGGEDPTPHGRGLVLSGAKQKAPTFSSTTVLGSNSISLPVTTDLDCSAIIDYVISTDGASGFSPSNPFQFATGTGSTGGAWPQSRAYSGFHSPTASTISPVWISATVADISQSVVVLESKYSCEEDQRIMKLFRKNNSHLAKWDDINGYNFDICYEDIFGVPYTDNLATVHSCSGKTPITWLSDTYNSHFSDTQSATYDTGICYGDLTCSVKATCSAGENEVLSLVANTNTHASIAGTTGYPEKLCCASPLATCGPAGPGEVAVCGCADLDTPNTKYVLQNDISMTVDDVCFLITADNVTLELGGHNVSSTYHPGTAILTDSQDITIANGIIHGFEYGVYLSYSDDVLVENITFMNNNSGWYALKLDYSNGNELNNLTFLNNFYAMYMDDASNNIFTNLYMDQTTYLVGTYDCNNNIFENITSYNSHYMGLEVNTCVNNTFRNIISSNNDYGSSTNGIELKWAENNIFENIVVNDNSDAGIYMDSDNINNTFIDVTANGNGVDGIYVEDGSNNTLTNITANDNGDSGIEFVASSNNVLKNIVAVDNDGVGIYTEDSYYTDVENAVANDNGNSGIILESCGSNSLINATANNNYYLGVELLSGSYCSFEESYIVRNVEANYNRWDGIYVSGHEGNGSLDISDVTSNYNGGWSLMVYDYQFIDIDGFVAITNETYGRYGGLEFNHKMTNSTLKNIFVDGSEEGIIFYTGQNVTLDNITINNIIAGFSWVGMFVWEFENSSFTNISITNVTGIGFYLEDSNDNTLTNVIVRKSSEEGFYIENSNRNYFSNVVSEENGRSGLFTDATSLDSTFDDSSFCYNTIQDVNCSVAQQSFINNFCNYDGSSCGGACTICPSVFSSLVVWTDLGNNEIEEADVGDTVKMLRVGAPSGIFEIIEDDPSNDDDLYTIAGGNAIVGVLGSSGLEGTWEITRADYDSADDGGDDTDADGHIEAFFLINSLRSKNLNISEDYDDEPMNITLISPFCGDYFMNGTSSTIKIIASDPDSIIQGNITIGGRVVNFSEGITEFEHNWTTPGNIQVEVFAVNTQGYLRRTVTSVMVVEPGVTRDYVAACIDKPADFSDITTPNVRFSANKSLGLHCTIPVDIGNCAEVGNIGLDFSWRFSDGLINQHHEGDDELSYLFHKNFATAGHNWAVLNVKMA